MKKNMTPYEFHITGTKEIIPVCEKFGIKHLTIEALNPDLSVFKTEYMTALVKEFETDEDAIGFCTELSSALELQMLLLGDSVQPQIWREKVERPYDETSVKGSVYIETHYEVQDDKSNPLSRIKGKDKLLATQRCTQLSIYPEFLEKNDKKEIELCIFDTYSDKDDDWFRKYSVRPPRKVKDNIVGISNFNLNENVWVDTAILNTSTNVPSWSDAFRTAQADRLSYAVRDAIYSATRSAISTESNE